MLRNIHSSKTVTDTLQHMMEIWIPELVKKHKVKVSFYTLVYSVKTVFNCNNNANSNSNSKETNSKEGELGGSGGLGLKTLHNHYCQICYNYLSLNLRSCRNCLAEVCS